MRDNNLNSFLDQPRVPGFALGGIYAGAQNCRANSFVCQNSLKSGRNVMLLCIDGEYLATASFGEFFSDLFDEFSFLRIELLFWKITCLSNHKPNIAFQFGIKLRSVQSSQ